MKKKLNESGGGNEYYLIIIMFSVLIIGIFVIYVEQIHPEILNDLLALKLDIKNPTAVLVFGFIGGLAAVLWWSWKKLEETAELHAKQDVSELLSLGKPMTKDEINEELRPKRFGYRLWSETINAGIDMLASENRISLHKMKYSLIQKTKVK